MARAMTKECQHPGYVITRGELVCSECGEPSPSKTWQDNAYGHESDEAIFAAALAEEEEE